MEALRNFQLKNSKMYKNVPKAATESLGTALKMIKKRRSLFEHGRMSSRYGAAFYTSHFQLLCMDMGHGRMHIRIKVF